MCFAGIQACIQHKFGQKFDLVQMKFFLTLENCSNKSTNRWLQFNHINQSQPEKLTFSLEKPIPWAENI